MASLGRPLVRAARSPRPPDGAQHPASCRSAAECPQHRDGGQV